MYELKELREKQGKLVTEARARLAEIKADTPEARVKELEGQHDAAMAEYDTLQARAQRLEGLDAAEQRLAPKDERRPNRENRSDRDGEEDEEIDPKVQAESDKALFRRAIQFGAEGLSDVERRSLSRLRANVTPEMRAQSIGTTTAGGYTVPMGFRPLITETMATWGPMLDDRVINLLPTDTGQPLPWPTINDTANTGADHTENTAEADQDVVFGQRQLDAYLATSGIVKVSLELLQDSAFDFESLLRGLFGKRLARRMNTKLTTGTGASQANGIVTAATLGKTAASATVLASDELLDLQHSVNPAYRLSPKCGWQFNDQTLKAIRKLKDGQGNYLWQMGDVSKGVPATLLDKPYNVNQAMADIATGAKPIIFGDMGEYITRIVNSFTMLTLRERYAEQLSVGFIAFARYDGELADTAAVKHLIMA
jgi:HK97 family phage major capsid protein